MPDGGGRSEVADADDDIHGFGDGAFRGWELGDGHLLVLDIHQRAGVDVIEVVVRVGAGIVEDSGRIDDHFTDQAFVRKQSQGVVHGGLRGDALLLVYHAQDLLGGQMLRTGEQHLRDLDPLLGGDDVMPLQQAYHLGLAQRPVFDHVYHGRSINQGFDKVHRPDQSI